LIFLISKPILMTSRGYIFLSVVVVVCVSGIIGYSIWNKPFKDPSKGNAVKVTATQLFTDFSTNEAVAQKKYVPEKVGDKILEITGEVRDTGKNADGETFYDLKTNDEMFGVKCVMDKGEEIAGAVPGNKITIRGFCDGYNMDVIVNRCKPVK
jgi:hypothetical protein